jgi:hypothetical protein
MEKDDEVYREDEELPENWEDLLKQPTPQSGNVIGVGNG